MQHKVSAAVRPHYQLTACDTQLPVFSTGGRPPAGKSSALHMKGGENAVTCAVCVKDRERETHTHTHTHTDTHTHTHTHTQRHTKWIYRAECEFQCFVICLPVILFGSLSAPLSLCHTHTHTHARTHRAAHRSGQNKRNE